MAKADSVSTTPREEALECLRLWYAMTPQRQREVIDEMRATPGLEEFADAFERLHKNCSNDVREEIDVPA